MQPSHRPVLNPPDPVQRAAWLADTIAPLAHRYGWRLVVLFGSAASGGPARDLDLALLPAVTPGLLEQGAWVAALEAALAPWSVDLLLVGDWTSPVARFEVFRSGHCLFEAEPGLYGREQDRAFFLYADSEPIRRQLREVLHAAAQP